MTILSNSKLLSESQEEDDGEWLFSPNIRRSRAMRKSAFSPKTVLDFDLVAEEFPEDFFGTDGILSPPPEEGSMYMDFPAEKQSVPKTTGQNPLFNDDIVRIMSPRSQATNPEETTTKRPTIITPSTPKSSDNDIILKQQKSPSSISSPFKGLDYQPKLFNPITNETDDILPASKNVTQKKKKTTSTVPKANNKTHGSIKTSSGYGVTSVKTSLKKSGGKSGLVSGKNSINSSSTGSLHKSGKSNNQTKKNLHDFPDIPTHHKERPSLKAIEDAFMEDLKLEKSTTEIVLTDSKEWKLMQWRRNHLKERTINFKPIEMESHEELLEVIAKVEKSPRLKKARSSSRLESPRGKDKSKSDIFKPQQEEPEVSTVIKAHEVMEKGTPDTSLVQQKKQRPDHVSIVLFGSMEHVPLELCRDVHSGCIFSLGVDVELYDSEQSDTPIYSERSLKANLELVDTNRNHHSREFSRSSEFLTIDEEDSPFKSAYYYIILGSSSKLPEAIQERVCTSSSSIPDLKVLEKKFWFTIRPEMDEFELITKAVFSREHGEKMKAVEEFDKNQRLSSSGKHLIRDLFSNVLQIAPKTPRSPHTDLKPIPRTRRVSSTGSIMEAVTLPPSPRTPSNVLIDVSERLVTPDSDVRRHSLPQQHPRRSMSITSHVDQISSHNLSAQSPDKQLSSQSVTSQPGVVKRFWIRLLNKLCLH